MSVANIKKVQQRLYASIKMGMFDKSNNIVNTGIIKQVFQCTAKVMTVDCCIGCNYRCYIYIYIYTHVTNICE